MEPLYYGPPNYGHLRYTGGCPKLLGIETCTYLTSELRTPLYSVKRIDFAVLLVPRLYKIYSILRMLAGLAQDCPALPIDSLTGHYILTLVGHSSSFWLSFLAIVRQGRAVEHTFEVLNSTSMHCHAYRKYTSEVGTPL